IAALTRLARNRQRLANGRRGPYSIHVDIRWTRFETFTMLTLSAFADEIDPDPQRQIDVLKQCGIRHIELRSILKTNVVDLTDLQTQELKSLLDKHGFKLSAIGSPIGKVTIDQPFPPHLQRFRRAVELAKFFGTRNIRIFSYYLTEGG